MENSESSFSLLDPSQIDMLLEDGNQDSLDMFSEILELFEQECAVKFDELKRAKSEKDVSLFGNASHTLAGSSANIGGYVVWQKAKAMENNCKSGDPESAFAMLDEIETDFAQTMLQLKAYLASFN